MNLFRVPRWVFKCRVMWVISLVAMVFHLCIWWWEIQAVAALHKAAVPGPGKQNKAEHYRKVLCNALASCLLCGCLGDRHMKEKWAVIKKKKSSKSHSVMMKFYIVLLSIVQLFAVKEIILALRAACNSPDPRESHWADPDYFLVASSQPSLKLYRKSLQLFLVIDRCLGLCRTPGSWGKLKLSLPKCTPFSVDKVSLKPLFPSW